MLIVSFVYITLYVQDKVMEILPVSSNLLFRRITALCSRFLSSLPIIASTLLELYCTLTPCNSSIRERCRVASSFVSTINCMLAASNESFRQSCRFKMKTDFQTEYVTIKHCYLLLIDLNKRSIRTPFRF